MAFHSILFPVTAGQAEAGTTTQPAYFTDLNLDQVIDSITIGRERYALKPLFNVVLSDINAVGYRHEVLQDLESDGVSSAVGRFARSMGAMREQVNQANKLRYRYQKESLFLDTVRTYCRAVTRLGQDLVREDMRSRGWLDFRDYLAGYLESPDFVSLNEKSRKIKDDLATVKYCLTIRGGRARVSRYDGETDYSAEVEDTFEKFQQGAVRDYLADMPNYLDMNHVEANVLELVTKLYPDIFAVLDQFCHDRATYLDKTITDFDREVQFYVAYLEFIDRLKATGLSFSYPRVSSSDKEVSVNETFDIALADQLTTEKTPLVCNDFRLSGQERVLVVTGPNQGGKTTFARTFGQLHYLAAMGLPVPGQDARLPLFDQLFTHFEAEEDIANLSGKLQDDLSRIHDILANATADSVIVMNESFTSTTLQDALFLGREILNRIILLDALCVYVTFVDELSRLGPTTVSVASTVVPGDLAERTFKIVRKPADGLAYAVAIAEKYGLTYEVLKGRIAS
ncbi:MAG TPA: hypothetical protein VHX38_39795 [Pseudonocardiaceae bacterium]|jgi:hypothetical protein|nr:hypothetical protein [Pseudonocardiaceae bacterium]